MSNFKRLGTKENKLLNDILDYIEDSESIDFEEQCNEKGIPPQDLIFNDDSEISEHIFYKAAKLRYLLSK